MNWMGGSQTMVQCRSRQTADADVAQCSADGIPPPPGGPVNSVTETTDTVT